MRKIFLLIALLFFAIPVFAVTTSKQTIPLEIWGDSGITSIEVSNNSNFNSKKVFNNGEPINWDICYGLSSCDYGSHTVYIHFIASDGSYVDINGSTIYQYQVTYKAPVLKKEEVPIIQESTLSPDLIIPEIVVPSVPAPMVVQQIPKSALDSVTSLLSAPETQQVLQTTTKSLGFFQVLATLFATLAPTLSGPALILLPIRLWNLILVVIGLRKRATPWGVVFDSLSKQPLDPVVVSLKDKNGKEIASSITDIDGRYGFLVDSGDYLITVNKTNYEFPSQILMGQKYDSVYENLYHGETLPLSHDAIVTKNLPMDPTGKDWNQDEKVRMHRGYTTRFMQFIAFATNALFMVGLGTSIIALIVDVTAINIGLFVLYVGLFIARRAGFKPRIYGTIKMGNKPLKNAILRVWSESTGVQVAKAVADTDGHYYALVAKGKYLLSVEIPDKTGGFKPLVSGLRIEGLSGVLNSNINLPIT